MIQSRIARIVQHHASILEELKSLQNLTKLSFLAIYYSAIAFISMSILIVFKMHTFNVAMVNNKISDAVTNLEWPERLRFSKDFTGEYKSVRTSLLVVMARAQHSLGLSCGGMFELDRTRFKSLVKATYSMVMFLWNVSPNYAPIAFPISLTQLSPAMKRTVRKIYESLLLVYSHLGSVNFLAIFIPIIELLCELKIIRNSFAGIFQNKPRYPSSKSAQTTFWIMTQSRINRLVQRHSDIIGELKSFEKLTRTSFLIIYYTAMLYVSMTIIAILNVQSFSMATIFLLEHILRMIVECYVFCHLATKLNEAHSQIADKIMNLDWPEMLHYSEDYPKEYKSVRTSLLIVTIRAQHSLGISCGGIFEMSQDKFALLVRMTYSVLMFLWKFKAL
ncbi:Odorant receptor 7a [Culex quinquefasciatus]|uniref:Odorant receptor n=1 Tax=Culex quinquefasciatus TaxID=7176 RepID=B0XCB1_CULQU|nr:Odorant receptor 7a [Culex quinquefasciatus]|eukprot:XP_001867283.1 Odorant receptor 7a [Culex quinquefasciatus]